MGGGDSCEPEDRGAEGVFLRTGRIQGGSGFDCGNSCEREGVSRGIWVTGRSEDWLDMIGWRSSGCVGERVRADTGARKEEVGAKKRQREIPRYAVMIE